MIGALFLFRRHTISGHPARGKIGQVVQFSSPRKTWNGEPMELTNIFRGIHIGVRPERSTMVAEIEEIVYKELNGLCGSCIHFENCVYRKNSKKVVIQCEVFESFGTATDKNPVKKTPLAGLCLNCSKNRFCHLPKEASGVWHCEEYE